MKPFNLQEASAGKRVCTRSGIKARIISFDKKGDRPIVALLDYDGEEEVYSYYLTGKLYKGEELNDRDLMMYSRKKRGWINIFSGDGGYTCDLIYKTRKEAINALHKNNIHENNISNYIDTIKITYKE